MGSRAVWSFSSVHWPAPPLGHRPTWSSACLFKVSMNESDDVTHRWSCQTQNINLGIYNSHFIDYVMVWVSMKAVINVIIDSVLRMHVINARKFACKTHWAGAPLLSSFDPSLFAYWLWSCVVTVLVLLTQHWPPLVVTC